MKFGKKKQEAPQDKEEELTEDEIMLRAKKIMEKNTIPLETAKDEQVELSDMSTYKVTVVNLLAAILEELKKMRE